MVLHVNLSNAPYDIVIEKGVLSRAKEELNLNRKVLVVTDAGVPIEYAKTICAQCKTAVLDVIEGGEDSKSLETFAHLQKIMLDENFSRKDCVVAVGGGVVGDLCGFVAATYMRGIDFYNIPTTVLSQVDSSIGGKTAVNFNGVKNVVGAFYQPKKVLIDVDVHKSLSKRLIANGLAEAFKMALTFDEDLFKKFEAGVDYSDLTDIIASAVDIKRKVVEEDEKEQGLRKVLNFGHTIGHGLELTSDGDLLHGESIAIGMLMMCEPEVKERIYKVMTDLEMPVTFNLDIDKAVSCIAHDKKSNGDTISTVYVSKAGTFEFRDMTLDELSDSVKNYAKGF